LAGEVNNSSKVTLLNFNRIDVFLYDGMASANNFLEAKKYSWCVCVGNFELRM